MLPFNDLIVIPQAFTTFLGRFQGERALCIGSQGDNLGVHLRGRFKTVEHIEIAAEEFAEAKGRTAPKNAAIHTMDPTALEFDGNLFNLVAFHWCFHRIQKRSAALAEAIRILKPQGRILLVEGIPQAANERQHTHLMLRQLLIDRDATLGNPSFPILTAEEIQREVKTAGFHHLRRQEYLQVRSKPDGDAELKERALDILRTDVIPSLARLGARRSEFEKRLVDIKQRIERIGIEIHAFAVLSGTKKVAANRLQPSLFAEEAGTPTAVKTEAHYELSSQLEAEDLPVEERLRSLGSSSLRTPELLALLLSPGQPEAARNLAERIVRDYGSRAVAEERDPYRLKETLNISLPVACQVVALFELGRRFFQKGKTPVLRSSEDVYHHLRRMGKLKREHFHALFLNFRGELVGDEVIATGNQRGARLQPREIFGRAAQHSAVALILCHNHPSGDPSPSPEDMELTRRLADAGKMMGIELVDHVIITDRTWTSFRDAHLL